MAPYEGGMLRPMPPEADAPDGTLLDSGAIPDAAACPDPSGKSAPLPALLVPLAPLACACGTS